MTNPTTPCSPVTVCIDEVCPLHSVLAGHDRRQHSVGVANLQAAAGGQFLHVKVCGSYCCALLCRYAGWAAGKWETALSPQEPPVFQQCAP